MGYKTAKQHITVVHSFCKLFASQIMAVAIQFLLFTCA